MDTDYYAGTQVGFYPYRTLLKLMKRKSYDGN